jgi:hypothetical protein
MNEKYGTSKGANIKIDKCYTKSIVPYIMERWLLKQVDLFADENNLDVFTIAELKHVIIDISDKEFNKVYKHVIKKGIILGLGDNLPPRVLKLIEDDIIRNTSL